MSDEPAVRLRGVSKKYQLYESLKHRVYEALHPFKKKYHREFWALRDIDLDIPKGATVGILGVNGSGKSTLLQIICGILQQSSGTVDVRGKVAALIELGAGFNPDITGRENAKINCAIMGLGATSTRRRLPEIEAFADIGEFFDQPVRTYSSGMFMRVAFATAISVEPDILIIDEALAVGDARFQQKCFSKFREFQASGKTILFVTHDRFAVPRLCDMALLLHGGKIIRNGKPNEVVNAYAEVLALGNPADKRIKPDSIVASSFPEEARTLEALITGQERSGASTNFSGLAVDFVLDHDSSDRCADNPTYNKNEHRYGDRRAVVIDYLIVSGGEANPRSVRSGSTIELFMKIKFERPLDGLNYGLSITTKDGVLLFGNNTLQKGLSPKPGAPGQIKVYKMSLRLDLGPGDVFLTFGIGEAPGQICDIRQACAHVEIIDSRSYVGVVALETEFAEIS